MSNTTQLYFLAWYAGHTYQKPTPLDIELLEGRWNCTVRVIRITQPKKRRPVTRWGIWRSAPGYYPNADDARTALASMPASAKAYAVFALTVPSREAA